MQKQTHSEHRELWSREGPRRAGNRAPKSCKNKPFGLQKQTHWSDPQLSRYAAKIEKQTHYIEENKGLLQIPSSASIKR